MSVELTPNGTYGAKIPKKMPPRSIMKILGWLNTAFLKLMRARVLTLITTGAKSGRIHQTDVGWFPDTDHSWLIMASKGGAATHPAWYYNLAHNPDKVWIKVNGLKWKVRPESLKGDERERVFKEIVSVAPFMGHHQKKTDRVIPIVRLTAETE